MHVSLCEDVGGCVRAFEGIQGHESVQSLARACKDVQEHASSHKDMQRCSKMCQEVQWSASSCEDTPDRGWVC